MQCIAFDGFAHQSHENSWYNYVKVAENATRSGFTKLGVHNVGALFTRGVLIDVAGYNGVEMLGDNYENTGSRGPAEEAKHKAASGRRRYHQHGLGQVVDQG